MIFARQYFLVWSFRAKLRNSLLSYINEPVSSVSSVLMQFLCLRCINVWNYLSEKTSACTSISAFKHSFISYNVSDFYLFSNNINIFISGHTSAGSLCYPVCFLTPDSHCIISLVCYYFDNCMCMLVCWFVQTNTIQYNTMQYKYRR